ncbi:protein of unknown function [Hyphomicrobium sp. 1Nfss2.1]|uniref:hypothetical protein n=1 Tax=Hyphomicrobium sp. 1Nfss2.1 TaxID=3413936 RepID=UPI003C79D2D0
MPALVIIDTHAFRIISAGWDMTAFSDDANDAAPVPILAYIVEDDTAATITSEIEQWRQNGVRVRVTGCPPSGAGSSVNYKSAS